MLAKQELLELIKARDVAAALGFATTHLAPFGEKNVGNDGVRRPPHVLLMALVSCVLSILQQQFLQEIEHTMSLLAFEDHRVSPLGYLLEHAQRRRVADEVNSAILRSQKQEMGALSVSCVRESVLGA